MKDDVALFVPSDASIKDWMLYIMAAQGITSGLIQSFRLGISIVKNR
jgi:hypothetical protein